MEPVAVRFLLRGEMFYVPDVHQLIIYKCVQSLRSTLDLKSNKMLHTVNSSICAEQKRSTRQISYMLAEIAEAYNASPDYFAWGVIYLIMLDAFGFISNKAI
jgi:hypothetical protein